MYICVNITDLVMLVNVVVLQHGITKQFLSDHTENVNSQLRYSDCVQNNLHPSACTILRVSKEN